MAFNTLGSVDTKTSTPIQIKSSAGTLYGYDFGTNDPNGVLISLYDSATTPTATSTLLAEIFTNQYQHPDRFSTIGIAFSNGLWIVCSSLSGTLQQRVIGHIEYA
jgi:hypothetical protein